nr:uncharacterized protein LOC113687226 [Coffea arabica]
MAGHQPPEERDGRSFATVLQHQPAPSPCKIKPAAQFKGEPAVMFSEEGITKLAAAFRFVVVGKFSHGRPNLDNIRKACSTIGFASTFTIGLLDQRHILIRFCLEEDYLHCWTKGLWNISGFPVRTFKWSPDFKVTSESTHAPVWVALEHLPIHFFDKASLFSIPTAIGSPLQVDAATASLSRPSVARICNDLDIFKGLPVRIWNGAGVHGFWQRVTYENLPSYCSTCNHQGHYSLDCRQHRRENRGYPTGGEVVRAVGSQAQEGRNAADDQWRSVPESDLTMGDLYEVSL